MKLVDLAGIHIDATTGAPIVLLREHDAPHRVVPIFIGGLEAAAIAMALSGQTSPRPLTYDIMAALVDALDARVDAVEVTELREGAFLAHLMVSGPTGRQQFDSRPSDAIAIAVRLGAPVYVSESVLDEAGTILDEETLDEETIDEETIDVAVAEFRSFLDDLNPSDFAHLHVEDDDPTV
jgi:hypothetical protein